MASYYIALVCNNNNESELLPPESALVCNIGFNGPIKNYSSLSANSLFKAGFP